MKRVLYLCLMAWGAPLSGQMGAQLVPDLSAFADAIAGSASLAPVAAPEGNAMFSSGLAVPSVAPGTAARKLGAQLRATLEAKAGKNPAFAQLEAGMPAMLTAVEGQLEKQGFQRRDLGVAMAYCFLINYETANQTKVPDEPGRVAARTLAKAIAIHWGPSFAKIGDAQKEEMYEGLIVSTTLLSAFSEQFAKAGKTAEADSMRGVARQMFTKLIGVPPAQVTISPDGRISGLGVPAVAPAAKDQPRAMVQSGIPDTYVSKFRATYSRDQLRKMNLDWKTELIPDEFGCFVAGDKVPTGDAPELTFKILDRANYQVTINGQTAGGTYAGRKGKYSNGEVVWMTGPFANKEESWLYFRHWGQEVMLRSFAKQFRCAQRGPGVEHEALARSRATPQTGEYQCGNGQATSPASALRLNADLTYVYPQGSGTYKSTVKYEYSWTGTIQFVTGPLAKASGTYKEDRTGERKITVDRLSTQRFAGGLTNIAKSETQYVCLGRGPARPFAAYGFDPAPALGSERTGLLDGLYFSFGIVSVMGYSPIDHYAYFTRDGWFTDEGPDSEEFDIDCKRTRPNGFPRCERYEVKSGQLLVEGEKPKALELAKDEIRLDKSAYSRAYSLAGTKPTGHFQASSYFSSGIGVLNTGGSSFTADLFLQPDGTFTRESASTTSYSNANQAITPNVTVGVYANSSNRTGGKIRFDGYTAELDYPDGRVERQFAFTIGDFRTKRLDYFNLGGRNFALKTGK